MNWFGHWYLASHVIRSKSRLWLKYFITRLLFFHLKVDIFDIIWQWGHHSVRYTSHGYKEQNEVCLGCCWKLWRYFWIYTEHVKGFCLKKKRDIVACLCHCWLIPLELVSKWRNIYELRFFFSLLLINTLLQWNTFNIIIRGFPLIRRKFSFECCF